MLFIRRGARNIFIRSNDIGKVADCIASKLGGKTVSFEEGWTEVREFQSIVFITPLGLSRTRVGDAERILMVPCESSQLLVQLFDKSCRDSVDTVQLGPGTILIRVVGDGAVLEEEFVEKYGARSMPLDEAISEGEIEDTVLIITNVSLSKSISLQEFARPPLLVHQSNITMSTTNGCRRCCPTCISVWSWERCGPGTMLLPSCRFWRIRYGSLHSSRRQRSNVS
jgi:hypothetical protein